jgi:hypothetical protein
VWDLDAIGVPSKLRFIRKDATLARSRPTLLLRCVYLWGEWGKPHGRRKKKNFTFEVREESRTVDAKKKTLLLRCVRKAARPTQKKKWENPLPKQREGQEGEEGEEGEERSSRMSLETLRYRVIVVYYESIKRDLHVWKVCVNSIRQKRFTGWTRNNRLLVQSRSVDVGSSVAWPKIRCPSVRRLPFPSRRSNLAGKRVVFGILHLTFTFITKS